MKRKNANTKKSIGFWVCLLVSSALFLGGFLVPPTGVIDGSILKAAGILLGFGALAQAPILLQTLSRAKFTKGDVTLEIEKNKSANENK